METDSKTSRNIVCCIPSEIYAYDEDKVNVTLQFMLERVVKDLLCLSTTGIPSKDHGATWLVEAAKDSSLSLHMFGNWLTD